MKKHYFISQTIITVITFVLFALLFEPNEPRHYLLILLLSTVVFGFTFLTTLISKKIVEKGKKKQSKIFEFLYYLIILPIIFFAVLTALWTYLGLLFNAIDVSFNNLGYMLISLIIATIVGIAPYIQSIYIWLVESFTKAGKEKMPEV